MQLYGNLTRKYFYLFKISEKVKRVYILLDERWLYKNLPHDFNRFIYKKVEFLNIFLFLQWL